MKKLIFNKYKIERIVQNYFPEAQIISYVKFSTGLVSPTFKIKINKPSRILVVKLSSLKNKKSIDLNNKILDFLHDLGLPCPNIYFSGIKDKKIITLMSFIEGKTAYEIFPKLSPLLKKQLLINIGANLRAIHKLAPPSFWKHKKHEVRTISTWKKWTHKRLLKYNKFLKNKLNEFYPKLEIILRDFFQLLSQTDFQMKPLHWDYHLQNINSDLSGDITGIFDFDNAMKGHNLADIGQTCYWIRYHCGDRRYVEYFLKGYKKKFTSKELILIKGYEILHILAVSRSVWYKQKRLGWLMDLHKEMLDELLK